MSQKFAVEIGLPSFEPEVNCAAYCYGGSVRMKPTTYPQYTGTDECWVRGDVVLEAKERADAKIAELQRSITIRDTEIARLETDLELARRDAGRYLAIKPHVSPGLVTHIYEDGSRLTFTEWSFAGVFAGAFRGDTLDEAIDAGPWWRKDAARAGNGGGV